MRNIKNLLYSIVIFGVLIILFGSCNKDDENDTITAPSTVTDIDGNVYHTIIIGTQVWMVENLKTTKYRDGSEIPNVTDDTEWINLTIGAYCNYNNDTNYSLTYGRLYNWYAVDDSRNIAPTGWHVSTNSDWTTLYNYMYENGYDCGSPTSDNNCAKSLASKTLWEISTSPGAVGNTDYPTYRNKSGFTALPSGVRSTFFYDTFGRLGEGCSFWSSTENTTTTSCCQSMSYNLSIVSFHYNTKYSGLSARCVMD